MSTASDLGERRIIEIIVQNLDKMKDMAVPFGDDVSAIDVGLGNLAVIKTDMLVGKTDIPPGMTMWQAARKAVVMNISDLVAKGVKPLAILASIGIPRDLSEQDIKDLGKGLNAGAREYGAYIVGGDTNEAFDLIISCTAFGVAGKLIFRNGARPGDIVAITGPFGGAAAGLKILLERLEAPLKIREKLLESVYVPKARLKEGSALASSGVVTASIDSSDGLAISLYELSRMSSVGFVITNLPVSPEAEFLARIHGLDPKELALYGGEEYELVVTIEPKGWRKALQSVKDVDGTLLKIGMVTKEKACLLRLKGLKSPLQHRGWEHFKG